MLGDTAIIAAMSTDMVRHENTFMFCLPSYKLAKVAKNRPPTKHSAKYADAGMLIRILGEH